MVDMVDMVDMIAIGHNVLNEFNESNMGLSFCLVLVMSGCRQLNGIISSTTASIQLRPRGYCSHAHYAHYRSHSHSPLCFWSPVISNVTDYVLHLFLTDHEHDLGWMFHALGFGFFFTGNDPLRLDMSLAYHSPSTHTTTSTPRRVQKTQ